MLREQRGLTRIWHVCGIADDALYSFALQCFAKPMHFRAKCNCAAKPMQQYSTRITDGAFCFDHKWSWFALLLRRRWAGLCHCDVTHVTQAVTCDTGLSHVTQAVTCETGCHMWHRLSHVLLSHTDVMCHLEIWLCGTSMTCCTMWGCDVTFDICGFCSRGHISCFLLM